jgi:hypothetical protein
MSTITTGHTAPAATSTSDWVTSSPFTRGDGASREGLKGIIAQHVEKLSLNELQKWCNVIVDNEGWKTGVQDTGKGKEKETMPEMKLQWRNLHENKVLHRKRSPAMRYGTTTTFRRSPRCTPTATLHLRRVQLTALILTP